jgi:hypothetical protein
MKRRQILDEYFSEYDLQIASLPNVASLGTPNHIELQETDFFDHENYEESSKFRQSKLEK